MQLFPATTQISAPGTSDGPAGDTRPASDPANADAFRAALSAANQSAASQSAASQNSRGATERPGSRAAAGRGGSTTEGSPDGATAPVALDESVAQVAVSADVLAAMLPLVTQVQTPQTPSTPLLLSTGDNIDSTAAPVSTGPVAGPVATASAGTSNQPALIGQPAVPVTDADQMFRLAAQPSLQPSATGVQPETPAPASAAVPTPATTVTDPSVSAAQTSPTGMPLLTTASEDAAPSTVRPLSSDAASLIASGPTAPAGSTAPAVPTATAAVAATVPAAPPPAASATPDPASQGTPTTAQAMSQMAAQVAAQVAASAGARATSNAGATSPTGPTGTVGDTVPAAAWADLAAEFGAQIASVTGQTQTATRTSAPATPGAGQSARSDEQQILAAGTTAQAAGAVPATTVALPGQAVAAVGAPGQGNRPAVAQTAGAQAFTESLAASIADVSAAARSQGGPDQTPEFNTVALNAASIGQARAAADVQVAAAPPPPVASQIADGAVLAAKTAGQSVQMVLQPEGLGNVSIKLTMERGGLSVHLAVDNPTGREMVQASWPQLQAALEQRGLTVQSMLLDLSNGGRGSDQFQAFQQFAGQQQFTGQQQRSNFGSGDRRGSAPIGAVAEPDRPQTSVGSASRVDYRI